MLEDMADVELEDQLRQAGTKLLNPPHSVEELLRLLDEVEGCLSKVEQSPSQSMQNALVSSVNALAATDLLTHADVDVRVYVASCVSEITRITAPDAPYSDEQMKQIFQLIVGTFEGLCDISSRSYTKRLSILETVAKVRSCVVMLDLECDGLILEMFKHFLESVRHDHPERVHTSMETIMSLVLEESEEISTQLLQPLLTNVKKDNQSVLPVARKLAEKVLDNCRSKLKPYLKQAVRSMGTSPYDYSKVVASICQQASDTSDHNNVVASIYQETSDTTEHNDDSVSGEHLADERSSPQKTGSDKQPEITEEPRQESALPREDNMVSEKSAKFATSNGDAPNVNDDTVHDIDSPNQEELSQPAHQGAQMEPDYLDPKIAEEEIPDQPAKRKRGRKPNFSSDTPEASGRSDIEVDKESSGIRSQGKSHNKEDDNSVSEDQSTDKLVLPSGPAKEAVKVTSPSASRDEHVKVGPQSPHQILPDEGPTKRGRGRPRKDTGQSSSLPKEESTSTQVVSDAPVSVEPVPKKGPDGEKELEKRPKRNSAKKGQSSKANGKTSGATSDSEEKPLKKSGKKVDKRENKGQSEKENEKISGKGQDKENEKISGKGQDKENEKTSGPNSDSEEKPMRKSGKKADTRGNKTQPDKELEKTPGATSDSERRPSKQSGKKGDKRGDKGQSDKGFEKDSGATSDSEEKPLKKSGKKADTKGSNRDESAAKKQGDKTKEDRSKKELPGESSDKKVVSAKKSTEKSASKIETSLEETPRTSSKRKRTPAKEETSEKLSNIDYNEDLVGSKIKVWWPQDKAFYEGIVESFDPSNKRHKVSYTDGDVEVLNLRKQRWEFIDDFSPVDVEEATDLPTKDATPEMPQKKKAKTNSDSASKQGKADASLKKGKETSTSKSKDGGSKSDRKSKIVDEEVHDEAVEDTLVLENDNSGKSKSNTQKTGSKSKDTPKTGTKTKADTQKSSTKSKDATPKTDTPKTAVKSKDATMKTETKSEDDTSKTKTKAKNATPKSSSKSGANGASAKGKPSASKLQESEGVGSGKGKSLASAQESETTSGQKRKRVKG